MSKLAQAKQIADKYRDDPHVWGRTKQVAGGLLVADGLVGLENPFDGKKTRPGIFGAAFMLVFGLVFTIVGSTIVGSNVDADAHTTGTITQVHRSSGSSGTTCSLEARYTVDGQTYTASTNGSSSTDCKKYVGGTVKVGYQSAHPSVGQIQSATDKLVWLFPLIGVIVLLVGMFIFLVRSASIVGGAILFFNGRKQAAAYPDANGNAAAAVAEVQQEVTGLIMAARGKVASTGANPGAVAGGAAGGLLGGGLSGAIGGGLGSLIGGALSSGSTAGASGSVSPAPVAQSPAPIVPASAPAPAPVAPPVAPPVVPATPPAGWYPTADGKYERYWDGATWSEGARPTQQ